MIIVQAFRQQLEIEGATLVREVLVYPACAILAQGWIGDVGPEREEPLRMVMTIPEWNVVRGRMERQAREPGGSPIVELVLPSKAEVLQ